MRRNDICIYVSPANRARLEAIITDRNSKTKAVWRARIVLATADGHGTNAILQLTGKSVITAQPGTFVLLSGKPAEYRKTAATAVRSAHKDFARNAAQQSIRLQLVGRSFAALLAAARGTTFRETSARPSVAGGAVALASAGLIVG